MKKGGKEEEAYQSFISQEWVYDYAVFRALKRKNGGRCWNEWETADRDWPETRGALAAEIEEEAQYQMFLQYLFYTCLLYTSTCFREAIRSRICPPRPEARTCW